MGGRGSGRKSKYDVCIVDACDRPHLSSGYCRAHYDRWRRCGKNHNHPSMQSPIREIKEGAICECNWCDKPVYCRGYCKLHYQRLKNNRPLFNEFPKGEIGGKWCFRCEEFHPIESFYISSECKAHVNKVQKTYRENNPDFYDTNRAARSRASRKWSSKSYHTDPIYQKAALIRNRIGKAYIQYAETGRIRENVKHSVGEVGYIPFGAILKHLGECPGEYGLGPGKYTIDHLVPLRELNLLTPIGYAIAVHPYNHTWMLWEVNYKKMKDWDMDAYGAICEDLGLLNFDINETKKILKENMEKRKK